LLIHCCTLTGCRLVNIGIVIGTNTTKDLTKRNQRW
jgi:hypothetical protein